MRALGCVRYHTQVTKDSKGVLVSTALLSDAIAGKNADRIAEHLAIFLRENADADNPAAQLLCSIPEDETVEQILKRVREQRQTR